MEKTEEKEKKIFDIRSQLLEYDHENKTVTLKLFDEIDLEKVQKLAKDGNFYTYLDFHDPRNISDAQRNYFWALMGSYEDYTGYPKRTSGDKLLIEFMLNKGLEEVPSTSRNGMKMEMARKLLQFVLEHMIDEGIPFYERQFYLAEDESRLFYALTMKRICWVCGEEHADLHHAYGRPGAGRDRNKFDHRNSRFEMLCRKHHNQSHSMGQKAFDDYYKLTPIKLDEESLRELNIQGNYEEQRDDETN